MKKFQSQVENQTSQPRKNSKSQSELTNGEANLNLRSYFTKIFFFQVKLKTKQFNQEKIQSLKSKSKLLKIFPSQVED